MSYKLEKPYTDKQRADFIVEYNHQQGLNIEETDTALYALEPFEKLEGDEVIDNTAEYEQEQAKEEAERIAMLNLTRGDVFRGILLAKGITKKQIANMIEAMPTDTQENIIKKELATIDFEDALNFFRGNSLIDTIGEALGITKEQLDKFFEFNNYKYLTTVKIIVKATPEDCLIEINGQSVNTLDVPYGLPVSYKISKEGYETVEKVETFLDNTTVEINLVEIE